jgi:hypothetical protein
LLWTTTEVTSKWSSNWLCLFHVEDFVVKMSSIRVMLGLAASLNLDVDRTTRCEDYISSWWFRRRNLHWVARGIQS